MTILKPRYKILLFDEYGTPTFETNRENDVFMGVTCMYDKQLEEELFLKTKDIIGLSKSSTKKSTELSINKTIEFAETISKLDITLTIRFLNLNDKKLESIIDEYANTGNIARLNIRKKNEPNIRERKISQIIHSNMLTLCMYKSIEELVNKIEFPFYIIEPYIDDWAIPLGDIEHYLVDRVKFIEDGINKTINEKFPAGIINIRNINLLKNTDNATDNIKRNRLIDCITGVVSRKYISKDNKNFTQEPLEIIQKKLGNNVTVENVNDYLMWFVESGIQELKGKL